MKTNAFLANTAKTTRRQRWMVVDDDEIILALLEYLLSTMSNAEIHCFTSPTRAIQAFEQNPNAFDVVFTDFNMPDVTGLELCHVIHMLAPQVKVVLATGSTDISEHEAELNGFSSIVHKPFTIHSLRTAIQRMELKERTPLKLDKNLLIAA